MKTLATLLYPPQCLNCDVYIDAEHGLCPTCWAQTDFIIDHPCDLCGRPLMGEAREGDLCDDCLVVPRAWSKGRAVMQYAGVGRSLVLSFKHGDRTDLAPVLGDWVAKSAAQLITKETLIAPVPLHWLRLLRRRYNQSLLLSHEVSKRTGASHVCNLLTRTRRTRSLDGLNAQARREVVKNAIEITPKHRASIRGRSVVLIDDVLTTGATLDVCASACLDAGASRVDVVVLARVASER
ncbi:ComF family protein [Celeribacter sp.]|uniref:ComF family protein n=1 Tax=Celeribacter sp. TaxID=1890673 RepID=UPI003A90DB01